MDRVRNCVQQFQHLSEAAVAPKCSIIEVRLSLDLHNAGRSIAWPILPNTIFMTYERDVGCYSRACPTLLSYLENPRSASVNRLVAMLNEDVGLVLNGGNGSSRAQTELKRYARMPTMG